MSAATTHEAGQGGRHDHPGYGEHANHGHDEPANGTLGSYLWGFGLSVLLTAIPFALVMADTGLSARLVGFLIVALAAVQVVVHMIFFLHMNPRSEGGWTALALVFTLIVVVITLSGTLWVMYHLNANMMPVHSMSDGL
ncbi:cytochrome o ubiquinol oxidase subunit IV [Aurantimonas sp. MSK8Z-1]|uniref:cytochrome o ubiquinol oxidase subunit IV n=1 Tax=Mangrovibrevibacter kandeliae TaxID=2968473 RepID=UPI002117381B|nr:cytochrome o ubiquinol oxidase subunit IV [Aurantimonas sp. MSK8Z-1]MCW4114126.1 cytochrome o ubiquinol oxidase subunit IV [Aurantimonas sp. MSK8Z-1]